MVLQKNAVSPPNTINAKAPDCSYRDEEELLAAAHARTDVEQTSEDVQHDLDIMNDDSKWNKVRESRISTPFQSEEPAWSRTHPGTMTTPQKQGIA